MSQIKLNSGAFGKAIIASVILMILFSASEAEAVSDNTCTAINRSNQTACAEEDNINVPFIGNIISFYIEATHPSYTVGINNYSCPANFTNCPPPTDPSYPYTPGVYKLFDDGETVIEKGLRPGETVVTDGQLLLTPGSKVTIKGQGNGGNEGPGK